MPKTLTPGDQLGPYKILSAIGEGGMGAVYRARDTKLNRDVAIKVLLPAVANDPERLARFQREAQVLASLNHPHIAAIFGLEDADGTKALVLELVEGPTLADRIAKGAIPLDEALPIAEQIAEALEAAHEQGIIHRDLKPANIKVRPDGTVKVLDFGLAKALEPTTGSSPSMSMSPTITTPAMTQAGMILGTAAYMSPEQAKGRAVDRRSDLWAFGAVLFEMLTGRRAFGGEDVSDTLAHILMKDPDWTALPADTPATIRRLVRRCLEKDVKRRARDAGDVRLDIDEALTTPVGETLLAGASATPSSVRGGRVAWLAFAVAVLVAAGFALPTVRHLREVAPPVTPETRTEISTPSTGDPMSFMVSPDGRQVVFVASGDGASRLWVRSLGSTTAQPLAGTDGATLPFWSPDSRSVAFFAGEQLKRVDLDGGSPRIVTATIGGRGGTWNADGIILFANAVGPVYRVAATGGTAVAVTTLDRQVSHRFPYFLPNGRRFLFYAQGGSDTNGIYLGTLEAGAPMRLTAADAAGAYLSLGLRPADVSREAAGWLVWVRAGALVAQRLDLTQTTLTGDAVTVAEAIATDGTLSRGAFSVSATGLLAYRTGNNSRRQLTWVDRVGHVLGTLGAPDADYLNWPRLAPDGRRVVVSRAVQGNTDVWVLDGARASRITFDAASDRYPIWSPDGREVVFASLRAEQAVHLYRKATDGAGADEPLVTSPQGSQLAIDWSPDGRFLLYVSLDAKTGNDLWVRPMSGDPAPWVWLQTPYSEYFGQFSPDGRFVVYESNESGHYEVYVRPFAPAAAGTAAGAAGGQWQVSTGGGIHPRWRADGREVYYLDPQARMMAAAIAVTGATRAPGTPETLFPTKIYGGGVETLLGPQYDVARDGRFLINTVLVEAAAPITLVQNWRPDVKK